MRQMQKTLFLRAFDHFFCPIFLKKKKKMEAFRKKFIFIGLKKE